MSAADPDGGRLRYGLSGPDAEAFTIGVRSGRLRVSAPLDYEAVNNKNTYTVWVTVSDEQDADGNANTVVDDTIVVTVNVIDVDEPGIATFSTDSPREGQAITPWISDPDYNVHNIRVRWERLESADAAAGAAGVGLRRPPVSPGCGQRELHAGVGRRGQVAAGDLHLRRRARNGEEGNGGNRSGGRALAGRDCGTARLDTAAAAD